jgi:predicted TIM-barrel fold metal-dependent hydrolase
VIIDAHHHLLNLKDYVPKLLDENARLGIDRVCLSALSDFPHLFAEGETELPGSVTNDEVRRAFEQYPDRVIGFAYFRLGRDDPRLVREFHSQGFRGLKVTRPTANYDDPSYYPVYEGAERLGMLVLFHTGMMVRTVDDQKYGASSARTRPVFLDTVARAFPALKLIAAHLGVPWHAEAAEVARFNPNVYVDLCGAKMGWRTRKSAAFFQELFFWPGAYEKIVFGTDVHWSEVEWTLWDQRRLFDALGLDPETQSRILGGTMAELLGIAYEDGSHELRMNRTEV